MNHLQPWSDGERKFQPDKTGKTISKIIRRKIDKNFEKKIQQKMNKNDKNQQKIPFRAIFSANILTKLYNIGPRTTALPRSTTSRTRSGRCWPLLRWASSTPAVPCCPTATSSSSDPPSQTSGRNWQNFTGQIALGEISYHLQGSMLWSQFSANFTHFRRKNWRFSQKPMLHMITIFAKTSFVLHQKRQYFR
jgi:hypothetical protein